jgi:ribonucleoside-diphosphate reductase alpha chain
MIKMIQVTKRNGKKEPLDIEKLHKVVFHACEGITGVSPSEVEIKSQIQFYNGIKTDDIQETLIKAAADLISEENPNYQYVGGRLINYGLRKEVYRQYTPYSVKELVIRNIKNGFYDSELLNYYSDEEWDKINNFIKHAVEKKIFTVRKPNTTLHILPINYLISILLKTITFKKNFEIKNIFFLKIKIILFLKIISNYIFKHLNYYPDIVYKSRKINFAKVLHKFYKRCICAGVGTRVLLPSM